MMLTAEDLLAGAKLTYDVKLSAEVLTPGIQNQNDNTSHSIKLKPLTVSDLQTISRAAKESSDLLAALMVQQSLVEPKMKIAEVMAMHVGLLEFILANVNRISGIETEPDQFSTAMEAPLTKAAFILAQEFGWTPEQINDLTLGQILLHLKMLEKNS